MHPGTPLQGLSMLGSLLTRGTLCPCCTRQQFPHSPELRGKAYHHSAKASGGEDLQIEEPVGSGYASAFHFYPTLTGMLGSTLITNGVSLLHTRRYISFL